MNLKGYKRTNTHYTHLLSRPNPTSCPSVEEAVESVEVCRFQSEYMSWNSKAWSWAKPREVASVLN